MRRQPASCVCTPTPRPPSEPEPLADTEWTETGYSATPCFNPPTTVQSPRSAEATTEKLRANVFGPLEPFWPPQPLSPEQGCPTSSCLHTPHDAPQPSLNWSAHPQQHHLAPASMSSAPSRNLALCCSSIRPCLSCCIGPCDQPAAAHGKTLAWPCPAGCDRAMTVDHRNCAATTRTHLLHTGPLCTMLRKRFKTQGAAKPNCRGSLRQQAP